MAQYNDLLGMNTRNLKYLRHNKKWGKKIADSKLLTKKLLKRKKVSHPKLLGIISNYTQLNEFPWLNLRKGFVIKPSEGFGGDGILVVKKTAKYAGEWITMDNRKININDLILHAGNILEGQYSRNRTPDSALIEERIMIHPKFNRYTQGGTPDIRIIVFNHIPVMAMLRLPTEESNGKANLHQGAIAVGIDIASGITTYAIHYDSILTKIPNTNKKVNGIVIPEWDQVLKTAVDAATASRLEYSGVDIVIDEKKGPLVLEINDQPGLQIQMANRRGLYRRLRRVEDLDVNGRYKGIQIAQILFAESFSDKVKIRGGQKIVGIFEKIKLCDHSGKRHEFIAKMDTGAFNISIDKNLAEELGLMKKENILYETEVESALGKQTRPVIEVTLYIQGRKITGMATIADRSGLKSQILIGRRYLKKFLVDSSRVENY